MNGIKHSTYDPTAQLAMYQLAHTTAAEQLHLVDLPYRFNSWALDHPENGALWRDEQGDLMAWAVLQTPFWTLDYVYRPEQPALHSAILVWADERARQAVDTPAGRPIWFVNCFTGQEERIADLEAAGFACQSDVGENSWSKVLMARAFAPAVTQELPAGFTIRPLQGNAEVDAYVALHRVVFQSNSMTPEWRSRTLQQPAYCPTLDLVVEAPDGQLAAFCVCWFDEAGVNGTPAGQIEPLGVHEDFRRLGLARAILTEGVRRLQEMGAQTTYVETDNYRDEAFALYEAVGFRVWQDVLVYRKDYAPL